MKKVWKKIGKGIKKAFMKIGKFMNKIGIVGQIALGLILPGIGSALGAWAGTASSTVFGAAAKGFVNAAINIGTKVGSVFKTVTQGVTKVVGETVGAVLNKIPGASDLIKNVTGKLGVNAGQGINIADKTFTTAFETAGQAITDTMNAGKDLFSMDTLTGTNKFALKDQLQKKLAEDIGDPFRSTEQTLAEKIQETSLDTPRLADGSIDQFSIDPNMSIDSSISEAMKAPELNINKTEYDSFMAKPTSDAIDFKIIKGEGIADAVRAGADAAVVKADESFLGKIKTGVSEGIDKMPNKLGDTIADAPSKVFNAGLAKLTGMGPKSAEYTSYSSQPAQFTSVGIGDNSMLMNTGAIQQDMSAGLQGMFGHPSAIFNDQQATEEFKQRAVGYGGGF